MINFISRAYHRIGIHAAPPGTLFFLVHSLVRRIVHRRIFGFASGDPYTRSRFGGIPYYNIARLRRVRPVNGLALVYFMGAGDYLMTTPLIRALHLAYPDLPIYAYGSSHTDSVNSALVIDLLKCNPLINRVFTYHGRPRNTWTDYDFSDVLKDIPKDFVILPVIYDVAPVVFHRTTSLLETFSLPVDLPLPRPIAYPSQLSDAAVELLKSIRKRIELASPKAVVCTHFGARSSGYQYPHVSRLISQLVRAGFCVVSFSPSGLKDPHVTDVDITTITPGDSIELLRDLKAGSKPLFLISVNSLMWPISAALDIPNLGIHVFPDGSLHQYLYPNIFVVTPYLNHQSPPFRTFLAPPGSYQTRRSVDRSTTFDDYNPEYIFDLFEAMASSKLG